MARDIESIRIPPDVRIPSSLELRYRQGIVRLEECREWISRMYHGKITRSDRIRVGGLANKFSLLSGMPLEAVMSADRARVLREYAGTDDSGDHPDRWPSQQSVALDVYGEPKMKSVKIPFLWAVVRLFDSYHVYEFGDVYREVLGLDHQPLPLALLLPEDDSLYSNMQEINTRTIEQVMTAPDHIIRLVCPSRPVYASLVRAMRSFSPGWQRNIEYADELPPEEAAKHYPQVIFDFGDGQQVILPRKW
ncbi:hypothetical protein A2Z33_00055 [Candidatus Gottesmanbacteria bacterium RBG_16_52_11]|uniref:Uncharacterized protein n=1 Tax=Candidatus Gottesmanbacteria bacterium RBG_16_52_11 TaxID=1798374 RepID=A0A1F5YNF2_9BACT|nr:MAG: hypothetical protein A2Z33_00055 [Candidatus Gottesmanbacteria bacterium RBG_16_52_11]